MAAGRNADLPQPAFGWSEGSVSAMLGAMRFDLVDLRYPRMLQKRIAENVDRPPFRE